MTQSHDAVSRAAIVLAALVVLGGCATREPPAELLSARQEVQEATQDPAAGRAAPAQIAEAQKALAEAETLYNGREDVRDVRAKSYLATRNAQIARQQGAELLAKEKIAASEVERNRVLLEARTREAEANAAIARQNAAAAEANAAQLAALAAKQTERGMVLTLGDVLFDTDKATVRPGAQAQLRRVADFLADQPDYRLIVEGHTDSRGSDAYNQQLSERRAEAVRNQIVSVGIDPSRVRAVGLGEGYPVASNGNAAGQQQNRRVEIIFSDGKGQFVTGAERGFR